MTGTIAVWVGFHIFIVAMLVMDLGVFHRKSHAVKPREAAAWTVTWVTCALLFAAGIWSFSSHQRAIDFVTAYVVEYSLSVDNIFVFVLIFSYFAVPQELQHRVLFWGIVGAVFMRGAMIAAGTGLLLRFHWLIYIFGAFLIWTGLKFAFGREKEFEPEKSFLVRAARRLITIVPSYHGQAFFVRAGGRLAATPLMLVLMVVETTDVVFAVDSIPAVFGVTRDPFIVYTSNIFAILGLRSLYFLVRGAMGEFRYLKPSLGTILMFVGVKMCAEEIVKVPGLVSLAVIVSILTLGVVASLIVGKKEARREAAAGRPPARPKELGEQGPVVPPVRETLRDKQEVGKP